MDAVAPGGAREEGARNRAVVSAMGRLSCAVAVAIVSLMPCSTAASADQPNRCVQCHYANFFDVPASARLGDWEQSAHAKHGVSCDRCHGGDPTTFVPVEAHRGVLASRHSGSPVNRTNLPTTCGTCHDAPVRAFGRSRHLAVLQDGDPQAPSCATCHGAMTARRPSPLALERTCAGCHGPASPSAGYPASARVSVEDIDTVQRLLDGAAQALAKVANPVERQRLDAERRLVESSVTAAIDALHAFDLGAVKLRVRAARDRVERLQREVAAAGG